jgi:hypothetical protein
MAAKECKIRDCNKTILARGYCSAHYDKFIISPEYRAWKNMKNRCYYKGYPGYKNWGGRGITICDEWLHDFKAFYNYIGDRPTIKHSIDRIDNDGNYEPGNIRWSTSHEQLINKRPYSNSGHKYIYKIKLKNNITRYVVKITKYIGTVNTIDDAIVLLKKRRLYYECQKT